jgi:hypothetical protein
MHANNLSTQCEVTLLIRTKTTNEKKMYLNKIYTNTSSSENGRRLSNFLSYFREITENKQKIPKDIKIQKTKL